MSRKFILFGACSVAVAAIVFVLTFVSDGGGTTTRKSPWAVTYPMPKSNSAAASQTNISTQVK